MLIINIDINLANTLVDEFPCRPHWTKNTRAVFERSVKNLDPNVSKTLVEMCDEIANKCRILPGSRPLGRNLIQTVSIAALSGRSLACIIDARYGKSASQLRVGSEDPDKQRRFETFRGVRLEITSSCQGCHILYLCRTVGSVSAFLWVFSVMQHRVRM